MNSSRDLIATGEVGKRPRVYIWDALNAEYKCSFKAGRVRGIKTIAWSKSS